MIVSLHQYKDLWLQQNNIENILYKCGIYFIDTETVNSLSKRLIIFMLAYATE